ncbi:very short patch repair endonuclease [Paraburkholderia dilworthii]|uniref:Very short patch repair endonuclease n=1 Tax=Paraburkholderia dilworthii TaxID=948106 RepID=A0ABW9DGM0_9BURK
MRSIDKAARSRVMSSIRSKNTRPELLVRSLLHRMGYRFRIHRSDLPGHPDSVLPRYRQIIFVHGCFWHRHTCPLGKVPKSNVDYWEPKIRRNQERDYIVGQALRELGWKVMVVWECEIRDVEPLCEKLAAVLSGERNRNI